MHKSHCILVVLLAIALNGCQHGPLGKRNSELCCPTDIRKTHVWGYGEDAIFCRPCGPDHAYYGHQPTCWRDWPSSGADWRDSRCAPFITYDSSIDGAVADPGMEFDELSIDGSEADLDMDFKLVPRNQGPQIEPIPVSPPDPMPPTEINDLAPNAPELPTLPHLP